MTVKAYRIGTSDNGKTEIEEVGVYTLYSFIIRSVTKAIKGGELIIYDAQVTAMQRLPEDAAIEIQSQWYKVASPAVGMLGMFRHYLMETARPE